MAEAAGVPRAIVPSGNGHVGAAAGLKLATDVAADPYFRPC